MSNLQNVQTEIRRAVYNEFPRLEACAAIMLLVVAALAGCAEICFLPSLGAQDFGSVAFGLG